MPLTDARRAARVDGDGVAVSLEDQDRGLWDAAVIDVGAGLVPEALTGHSPNSWPVQAAIAALHDEAPSVRETDRHQVRLLYDEPYALTPTPVAALARGPRAGLDHLDALAGEPGLTRQHHWHAARGHALARLGRPIEAAQAYRRAAGLAREPSEIAYLTARAEAYDTPG